MKCIDHISKESRGEGDFSENILSGVVKNSSNLKNGAFYPNLGSFWSILESKVVKTWDFVNESLDHLASHFCPLLWFYWSDFQNSTIAMLRTFVCCYFCDQRAEFTKCNNKAHSKIKQFTVFIIVQSIGSRSNHMLYTEKKPFV